MSFIVLVTDHAWDSLHREQEALATVGATLLAATTAEESELIELAPRADAMLTCFAPVTAAVVAAAPNLRVIGRYGIGVDNIAVDAATARGIPVTNVPAYCLDEVAEHVLGLILCLARGIHRYDAAVHRSDWSLGVAAPIHRLVGRTLGIVGFGKIGRMVALRGQGLGLHVVACDPRAPDTVFTQAGVERGELAEVVARSDFLTLHVPATPETEGLIDAGLLAAMRPDAYLINTSRGSVVDQHALLQALSSGRLAGAGLDVFVPERLAPDHPLLGEPSVIATPHVAFYSEESLAELASQAARNVAEVLAGRR
ncbi:MAG: C-terminal binding protein, partial [Solirubrobacteraceae bacterium]